MAGKTDKKMAKKSLKEEETAVKEYTKRKKRAKSGKLKKALAHAIPEERHHAKMFRKAA